MRTHIAECTGKQDFYQHSDFNIRQWTKNINLQLLYVPLYSFEIKFPFMFIPEFGQEVRSLDFGRLGRTISTGTSHAEFEQYSA